MAKKNNKSKKTKLKMARLSHGKGLPRPAYQSKEAAGLDLVAAVAANKAIRLKPGARALIPTGLCFELPKGFEAQIRPRSGLALKHGITVLNTPGTIDSDYRGEVQVILINLGSTAFTVQRGERIAQMVIAPVVQAKITTSKKLAKTQRGKAGFGSTGSGADKPKKEAPKRKISTAKSGPGSKLKEKSKAKAKRPAPKTKPAKHASKQRPRIAAKSKPRTPIKRKTAAATKRKSARPPRRRAGSAATKARSRLRRAKK